MLLLHLSDLHFGSKNRFADDSPTELGKAFHRGLEVARAETIIPEAISLVIVTGDLAEYGLPSEFSTAREFLSALAGELGLAHERFVFVPGNHDISWDDCHIVRAGLRGQKFDPDEFDLRLNAEKLANYRVFLGSFYGGLVTDDVLSNLPGSSALGQGGWLRDFPDLEVSIGALNTSERENDELKGGYLSHAQAQSLMSAWRAPEAESRLKVVALHHNPVATTAVNTAWTLEWLRQAEAKSKAPLQMPVDVFQHYLADLAGFEGKQHLAAIVRDTKAHCVLHGHHHDQGAPTLWPWSRGGNAPVLSVGSLGLNEDHLPGNAPLSCQFIRFVLPPEPTAPRLEAIPLVYDGRFRLEGQVLEGAFRRDPHSQAAYDQDLPLPASWKRSGGRARKPGQVQRRSTRLKPSDPVPRPPALYTEPAYIGSYQFVGRQAQLDTLSDWAAPNDSHPVLLFEAIGGTGKSMLTWEWTTKYSAGIRDDWEGRFWYSFYEKGATMADFCRRALSYMTGRSRTRLRDKGTAELIEPLMHQLQNRPWLLVLDGLERVLVAYHRFDAAQLPDETAGFEDHIAHRDPCVATNPEDDDLLRALAGAHPSKLLLTSRLVPRVLLNRSSQPIPGVLQERLPGLRPADAELLIRSCGVTGRSADIQNYLKSHCDCHPLVIGVLAGLITNYLPDRGNFDSWQADPRGGGQLNLASLDLVQKRNHILAVAVAALPQKSRELLSTIALLSEAVDYPTLCALNPHLPPVPEKVDVPVRPDAQTHLPRNSTEWEKAHHRYAEFLERHAQYEKAVAEREAASETAAVLLGETVRDLERRGLLQYDAATKRHDLHPVVRGIAAGGLKEEEKNDLGNRVVDYFSRRAENPHEDSETLADFDNARRVVKALFHMGQLTRARDFIVQSRFLQVMSARFEAHSDVLTIIKPFFVGGWSEWPQCLAKNGLSFASRASVALRRMGQLEDAFTVSQTVVRWTLARGTTPVSPSQLLDLASTAGDQHRLALEDRLIGLADDVATIRELDFEQFSIRLARFRQLSRLGRWDEARALLPLLLVTGTSAKQKAVASHHHAVFLWQTGNLSADALDEANRLNHLSRSALGVRNILALRGSWQLEQEDWAGARLSLIGAIDLAHKAGKSDRRAEIALALARCKLNQSPNPRDAAEALSTDADVGAHYGLAELWLAAGEPEEAIRHATAAYNWAWADGEPFVHRFELLRATTLLQKLGAVVPSLAPFDPTHTEKLSWEDDVRASVMPKKKKAAFSNRPAISMAAPRRSKRPARTRPR